MENYQREIGMILSNFVKHCKQVVEIKLVNLNLNKIGNVRNMLKLMAKSDETKVLIENIAEFLQNNFDKNDFTESAMDLIRFVKKISEHTDIHDKIYESELPEIALKYMKNIE